MGQTRKKNNLNTLRNKNIKRYGALANTMTRKNEDNRYKLNRNQGKLQKNLVKLGASIVNTQARLTNRVKKEGSKLSKKVLENPALMNAAKALFFKQLSIVPGVGSALNKASSMKNKLNKTANSIKNKVNITKK